MPREHKKRGRRAEQKKRKVDDGSDDEPHDSKRQKQSPPPDDAAAYIPLDDNGEVQQSDRFGGDDPSRLDGRPFFGLLDDEEQEYFRRADEMLELNQFADHDEQTLFLASVYREAEGKELKLANSQSCSRLMERLIQLSTADQLKQLFQKFAGQYVSAVVANCNPN